MMTREVSGVSPIYEYPPDIPLHPAGVCDGKCPICVAQENARLDGSAKVIWTMTWSGTETHGIIMPKWLQWLLGRECW